MIEDRGQTDRVTISPRWTLTTDLDLWPWLAITV